MSTNSLPVWIPKPFKADCFPLILGGVAAAFASFLVFVPLSAVAVGALLILILSCAENDRFEPASLTKLMTGYVVYMAIRDRKLDPAQSVIVSANAARADGSRMYLALIHLLEGDHDAALAEAKVAVDSLSSSPPARPAPRTASRSSVVSLMTAALPRAPPRCHAPAHEHAE